MAVINLAQVASPSAPSDSTDNIFIDTSGNLSVQKPDGNIVKLAAAGTYTLTIPATGTAALRDVAQTFSEAQTFSVNLTAPGIKPAADGTTAFRIFKADGTTAVLTADTTNSYLIGRVPAYEIAGVTPGIGGTSTLPTVIGNPGTYALTTRLVGGVNTLSDSGLYLLHRQGTATLIDAIVTMTALTVAINGSYQVTLTNTSATNWVYGYSLHRLA
jgi:hypothetical protein